MTSETAKPGPAHECEPWQIRRHPSGGRYCAACGALQAREGTDEQVARLLADIHLMELEEELDDLAWAEPDHRGTVTAEFPEAGQ